MANGTAVRTLERPSAPRPAEGKPDACAEISTAMANAAIAICRGWEELEKSGCLTAATRKAGAERIYRLHELRRGMEDAEFIAASRAGKQLLRQHLNPDPDFYRRHGPNAGEATLDNIITEILAAVDWVAKFERELAN